MNNKKMRVAALAAVILGLGFLFTNAGQYSHGNYRMSGRVHTLDGNPIRSAQVLIRDNNTGQILSTVTTGSFGEYKFENLPAGDYCIGVKMKRYDFNGNVNGSDTCVFGLNYNADNLNISAQLIMRGRVVDANGRGVPYVIVHSKTTYGQLANSKNTDANGYFELLQHSGFYHQALVLTVNHKRFRFQPLTIVPAGNDYHNLLLVGLE